MPDVSILRSIREIDQAEWDACSPHAVETHDYLRSVEDADIAGFEWRYVVAREEGRVVVVAPAFLTAYSLDTTLTGVAKRIARQVASIAPGGLKLRLACLGSPCTEDALIGIHPDVAPERTFAVFQSLLTGIERAAAEAACGLVAIKDLATGKGQAVQDALRSWRCGSVASMPTAVLHIDFSDMQEYMGRLSAATRKDMRRKLKALDHVRIETRSNLDGYEEQVFALYRNTLARAELSFEELTPAYFRGVLANMGHDARCVLYFVGDQMLAANLLIRNGTTLLDKFFVMDADRGRPHNLYYLSWFHNVGVCLDANLTRYVSGQAGYANKLRLGCVLEPTRTFFRHRNVVVNGVLRMAAPMLSDALTSEVRA